MSLPVLFGTLAAICMICGYVPQAWVTMKTRDTDGIAMPTFIAMGLGSLFFVLNGIFIGSDGIPLVVTNSITLICSIIIVVIKISNDCKKKQKK